jgi:hypothetical protein
VDGAVGRSGQGALRCNTCCTDHDVGAASCPETMQEHDERAKDEFPLVVRVGSSETGEALSLLVVVTVALVGKIEAMAVEGQGR